jgi:hypothetical protein
MSIDCAIKMRKNDKRAAQAYANQLRRVMQLDYLKRIEICRKNIGYPCTHQEKAD